MPAPIKHDALVAFVKLANTISAATQRLGELRPQIAVAAQKATAQIAQLSSSAQSLSVGNALIAGCHCNCGKSSNASDEPPGIGKRLHRNYQESSRPIEPIVTWGAFVARLSRSGHWLPTVGAAGDAAEAETPAEGLSPGPRLSSSFGRLAEAAAFIAAAGVDRISAVLAPVAEILASLSLPEWGLAALGTRAVGGGGHPAHRNHDAIRGSANNLAGSVKAGAHELPDKSDRAVRTVFTDAVRAIEGTILSSAGAALCRLGALRARIVWLASRIEAAGLEAASTLAERIGSAAMLAPMRAAIVRPLSVSPIASDTARIGGPPRFSAFRRAAVAAVIAAPMLTAPALAAVPSRQRGAEPAPGPSLVINSAPSIVINAGDPGEIERRVLDALGQHRDAIYEQWHRELRRRQRTEF